MVRCAHVLVHDHLLITVSVSHEAVMADLKYKLKNIEEELQTANKCENNNVYIFNLL